MPVSVSKKSARQARWRARVKETKRVDALLKARKMQMPPRWEEALPPTTDSPADWNRYLANQRLGTNQGRYMKDAPQGCGKLLTGGNSSITIDEARPSSGLGFGPDVEQQTPDEPEPLNALDSITGDIARIKRAHSKAGRAWPTAEEMAWILNVDAGRIASIYRTGHDPHFELKTKFRRRKSKDRFRHVVTVSDDE